MPRTVAGRWRAQGWWSDPVIRLPFLLLAARFGAKRRGQWGLGVGSAGWPACAACSNNCHVVCSDAATHLPPGNGAPRCSAAACIRSAGARANSVGGDTMASRGQQYCINCAWRRTGLRALGIRRRRQLGLYSNNLTDGTGARPLRAVVAAQTIISARPPSLRAGRPARSTRATPAVCAIRTRRFGVSPGCGRNAAADQAGPASACTSGWL